MPENFETIALWWGPGILVLMVFGYGAMRLAHHWIEKTMEVKSRQTESAFGLVRDYIEQFLSAQQSQAEALSRLAASVERRDSHESFEHQEMLIALKALHRDIADLACRGAGDVGAQHAAFPTKAHTADVAAQHAAPLQRTRDDGPRT